MKKVAKTVAQQLCNAATLIFLPHYWCKSRILGRDLACLAASQMASRWAGLAGQYLRYALLRRIVAHVGKDVVISFGSVLTKPTIELGDGVYVGSYCLLGDVRIGDNTLIADHVCVPSGSAQHGLDRLDVPVRDQPGEFRTLHVGCDCWIGSGAIILADVGDHCVIAAGSVVTRGVEDYQIVAGNPARPIGDRREKTDSRVNPRE